MELLFLILFVLLTPLKKRHKKALIAVVLFSMNAAWVIQSLRPRVL